MTDYSKYRVNPITMPPKGDPRDYLWKPRTVLATALPSEMLLEEEGVADKTIYDQGQEGACTGHSEAFIRSNADLLAGRQLLPYSRAFIYYEARKREGTQMSDSGAQVRDGLQAMVDEGVPPETAMPYIAGQFAIPPGASAYADAAPGKIARYEGLPSVNYVCQVIGAEKRAVSVATGWYNEWDNLDTTGILPQPRTLRGYHSPAICGYKYLTNPQTQQLELCLRIHNSWGPGWGLGGHAWIPASMYDQQGCIYESWVLYLPETPIPTPNPTPSVLQSAGEAAFVIMGRGLKSVGDNLETLISQV